MSCLLLCFLLQVPPHSGVNPESSHTKFPSEHSRLPASSVTPVPSRANYSPASSRPMHQLRLPQAWTFLLALLAPMGSRTLSTPRITVPGDTPSCTLQASSNARTPCPIRDKILLHGPGHPEDQTLWDTPLCLLQAPEHPQYSQYSWGCTFLLRGPSLL